jgi:hypothetical protein
VSLARGKREFELAPWGAAELPPLGGIGEKQLIAGCGNEALPAA